VVSVHESHQQHRLRRVIGHCRLHRAHPSLSCPTLPLTQNLPSLRLLKFNISYSRFPQGRLDTVESEKTARIAKREENINVKKMGKAPSVPVGEEKGDKVGPGSGRPRLGFPKPGSQSEGGDAKTSIRSAGGDKGKGRSTIAPHSHMYRHRTQRGINKRRI
jgi:hypothetical protein